MELTVTFLPSGKRAKVKKLTTILEAAQSVGEGIRSLCGGKGSCGKCKVVVKKGSVEKNPEPHEKFVSKEEEEEGVVLACQSKILSDLEVFIPPESRLEKQQILSEFFVTEAELNPAVRKEFYKNAFLPEVLASKGYTLSCETEIEEGDFTLVLRGKEVIAVEEGDTRDKFFGLAVDIGTTTIVVALVDLNTGRVVNIASDYNGQIIYGEEVLSRVEFARSRKDGIKILQKAVVDSINKLIEKVSAEYVKENEIYDVVVAGNTLMTHFFLGEDVEYLFSAPNVKVDRKAKIRSAKDLGLKVSEGADVFCYPLVGRYIGGDIVADLVSSGIASDDKITLMVDLGTNGEIVIGSEGWAMATSVASGPAFEGYEIKHGSRAVEGAIDHVKINGYDAKPEYTVIGNVKPRSICGSGLIDLLAELFKNGIVDFQGTLDRKNPRVRVDSEPYYVVVDAEESATGKEIVFTQTDIDTLIKSKAAVCAGISVMLKKAGLSIEDIDRFVLAGAFGYYIDMENAVTIGLFPEFPKAEVRQIGNGSLAGCYLALTNQKKRFLAETIARLVSYFDLSTDPDFMEEYNAALNLPGKPELFPTIYARYV
ncbi:ASKHA domain-containing protein [Ferroglobus sp.]|uniref:ASKHA domain-containing protein n=1 Tax=Ferroglobus sp. TaxID=2614230 RepID=UPI0025BAA4E1|nr:ASKHA domain-containing protein [Ferroglobus sp.]